MPQLLPGDNPQAYIPGDRRRSLARGEDLPAVRPPVAREPCSPTFRLSDAAAPPWSAARGSSPVAESGAALWSTQADLVTYDAADNVFRANLKAPTLRLAKGKTYEVQLRVLATDPQPPGVPLQSDFDLGHRSFWISLK